MAVSLHGMLSFTYPFGNFYTIQRRTMLAQAIHKCWNQSWFQGKLWGPRQPGRRFLPYAFVPGFLRAIPVLNSSALWGNVAITSLFKKNYFIVVQLQLFVFPYHPSTPPQPNPPPSPASTLSLGFVHVSFIVVPENPSAHCLLPRPLWLLSDCS